MQLILGDCLEKMKDILDGSIDMILCDLPYGTTACKWDTIIPFEPLWEQYERIIKENGAIVLFGSEPFSSYLRMSNIKQYKYDWIWKKNAGSNFALLKYMPMKEHEMISVFCNSSSVYYPIMQERAKGGKTRVKTPVKYNNISDHKYIANKKITNNILPELRYPSSVQNFNRERGLHPTQKPVALLEYLIKTYTLEGETVLDNTMGSGSTGVACVNTERDFIGIELDEKYFEIAQERIKKAQQEKASNLPIGEI
jgi:site-specific DNA-methyltransferase (adenine-specific)